MKILLLRTTSQPKLPYYTKDSGGPPIQNEVVRALISSGNSSFYAITSEIELFSRVPLFKFTDVQAFIEREVKSVVEWETWTVMRNKKLGYRFYRGLLLKKR